MDVVGPNLDAVKDCERVLRSLPAWFGIEESLVEYAKATRQLPSFAAIDQGEIIGFVSLKRHFAQAWELHCIAVASTHRGNGVGAILVNRAEAWLLEQGVVLLQVKTIADAHPSIGYAQTRRFYERVGFKPLEVFPTLWGAGLPVLQLIKILSRG